jgi:arylformamidase
MKIYDISRTLSPTLAVWPGDQKFEHSWTMEMAKGSAVNVSAIKLTVHAGTHADAPLHFLPNGADITQLSLERFVGAATVIEIEEPGCITVEHIHSLEFPKTKRVLFKTRGSFLEDDVWEDNFSFLGQKTAEFLGENKIELVGMDTPSVDSMTSKILDSHKTLARYGIVNLENLNLSQVSPGDYQLIALPLKLKGIDASPVRAVLVAT